MKIPALVILCALAFGAGIWLSSGKSAGSNQRIQAATSVKTADDPSSPEGKTSQSIVGGDRHLGRLLSALQERSLLKRRNDLFEALRDVTPNDLIALIARVQKLPPTDRHPLLAALIERWLELDTTGARSWILAHPVDADVLTAWARVDPAAALEDAFSGSTMRRWRPEAIKAAVEALAGPGLRDQVKRLAQLPSNKLRDDALAQRIEEWAEKEPNAAFQFANDLPPGKLRDRARGEVLLKWAESDPAEAVARVQKIIPELTAGVVGSGLLTQMADVFANKDPNAALKFASELPSEFRSYPAIAAARAWAKTDPIAALEWCQMNGIDVARGLRVDVGGWTGAVLKEAMLNHPQATVEWIEALLPGSERDRLLVRSLYERLDNVPIEELFANKNEYILRLFDQIPAESQELAAASIGRKLASQSSFNDLRTITDMFPDKGAQLRAVTSALSSLYMQNPTKSEEVFAKYTENLQPGPEYDAAIKGIANGMTMRAPAEGMARAMTIGDPTTRQMTLDGIMGDWVHNDAKAAQAWLTEAKSLPQDWVVKWQTRAAAR